MQLKINSTYLTRNGTHVKIVKFDEFDDLLPWYGNNDIWYSDAGDALFLEQGEQERLALVSEVSDDSIRIDKLEDRIDELEVAVLEMGATLKSIANVVAFPIQLVQSLITASPAEEDRRDEDVADFIQSLFENANEQ